MLCDLGPMTWSLQALISASLPLQHGESNWCVPSSTLSDPVNQFMYLLWDVAEVLKQSSHQAKLLSGLSNQGNVHLTQAATFSFPENCFPFCFGCQEAQSPTKAPLLASAQNFCWTSCVWFCPWLFLAFLLLLWCLLWFKKKICICLLLL